MSIDPFSLPPVFENDQVITKDDLINIKRGLIQLRHLFHDTQHIANLTAVDTMLDFTDILLEWVLAGKPDRLHLKDGVEEGD